MTIKSDKHVNSFLQNEYKPEKVQSQLANMVVYDIDTFNTIKCVPLANCIYRISPLPGKYIREITQREHEKCKKDCIVFKGLDNINKCYIKFYNSKEKA